MKKKIVTSIIALAMAASLAACGKAEPAQVEMPQVETEVEAEVEAETEVPEETPAVTEAEVTEETEEEASEETETTAEEEAPAEEVTEAEEVETAKEEVEASEENTEETETTAQAEVKPAVTIPDWFDASYYAEHNKDVVASIGNSAEALYKHYTSHGKSEGRAAYEGDPNVKVANQTQSQAQANTESQTQTQDTTVAENTTTTTTPVLDEYGGYVDEFGWYVVGEHSYPSQYYYLLDLEAMNRASEEEEVIDWASVQPVDPATCDHQWEVVWATNLDGSEGEWLNHCTICGEVHALDWSW